MPQKWIIMQRLEASFSRINTYNFCPRKYRLKYHDNVNVNDFGTSDRRIGSCFHEMISHSLQGGLLDDEYYIETYGFDVASKAFLMKPYISAVKLTPYKDFIEKKILSKIGECDGYEIYLNGIIDAVFETSEGLLLVDWKTRGKFAHRNDVRVDGQLYLYATALRNMGVPIKFASQIQLLSNAPSRPRRLLDGTLHKTLGITTKEIFDETLIEYGMNPSDHYESYQDKFRPLSYFIESTHVPLDSPNHQLALQSFMESVVTAHNDTKFRGLHDLYRCSSCPFVNICAM